MCSVCVCAHTHTRVLEYDSAIKKNKIMTFAGIWMKIENPILSEASQREKDKHYMITLTCGT